MSDATAHRSAKVPGALGLVNGVLGLILILAGLVEWQRKGALDLPSALRLGVFVGIAAMGFSLFATRRRLGVAAAVWTLACAAAYLLALVL